MALIRWSEEAADDFDRLVDFLLVESPHSVEMATARIHEAVGVLEHHPLVGREVPDNLRELVISYGRAGYIALYSFDEIADQVMILALRHQRELGTR